MDSRRCPSGAACDASAQRTQPRGSPNQSRRNCSCRHLVRLLEIGAQPPIAPVCLGANVGLAEPSFARYWPASALLNGRRPHLNAPPESVVGVRVTITITI